jgi:hypothetical protein
MTRNQLEAMTRFMLDQLPADWLKADDASAFDMADALLLSLNDYYIKTKCSPVEYTLAATANTHTYRYDAFGSGTPKTGGRMFEITYVGYNSLALTPATMSRLAEFDPNWRHAASGTPAMWIPNGERAIRLWPTPSSTLNISVAGYQIPDPATFDTGTESPDIFEGDMRLIALGAALLPIMRDPSRENMVRASALYAELEAGYAAAHKRIHGAARASLVVGRRGVSRSGYQPLNERISTTFS